MVTHFSFSFVVEKPVTEADKVEKSTEPAKTSTQPPKTSTQTPKTQMPKTSTEPRAPKVKTFEKKEKTAEVLALEQQRAEELSAFTKSVEAKDVATAFYEINNYLTLDKFIPPSTAQLAIEFFEKSQAWEEGGKILVALLKRNMDVVIARRRNSTVNIISNLKPELRKEVDEAMKNKVNFLSYTVTIRIHIRLQWELEFQTGSEFGWSIVVQF